MQNIVYRRIFTEPKRNADKAWGIYPVRIEHNSLLALPGVATGELMVSKKDEKGIPRQVGSGRYFTVDPV